MRARHVYGDESLGYRVLNGRDVNGPVGVGMGDADASPATALPSTMGLAAGFDLDLAEDGDRGWSCARSAST